MPPFESVNAILDFAIGEERQAQAFYRDLAGRADSPALRQVLEDFALEEKGHEQELLSVKRGERLLIPREKVADLHIADYVVDVEPSPSLSHQDALILAMKKEKAAFKLYTDLAAATDNPTLKQSLLALAQEEAKHKLRFEIEYDNLLE